MIGFFKLLCLSFATVTLCAVFLALFFSWQITNPKMSQEYRDRKADYLFQCAHVAQWTILAAGISGVVWCLLECIAYLWVLE